MKGNRKMKKHNNGNSSADLFNKIKLEMFRKIHGLSEKDVKAALAEARTKGRKKATVRKTEMEGYMSAEEFFK